MLLKNDYCKQNYLFRNPSNTGDVFNTTAVKAEAVKLLQPGYNDFFSHIWLRHLFQFHGPESISALCLQQYDQSSHCQADFFRRVVGSRRLGRQDFEDRNGPIVSWPSPGESGSSAQGIDHQTEPEWTQSMLPGELRALTPPAYAHVTPYGNFRLDMSQRLAIEQDAVTA